MLAYGAEPVVHAAHLPARQLLRALRHGSVAVVAVWLFLFSGDGLVNQVLGPLAPGPVVAGQLAARHADDRALRHLEAAGVLHPALPRGAAERAEGAVRGGVDVDGAGAVRTFFSVTVPGVRPATLLVLLLATITGANLFTEPYLLTGGGGPNGASASPVLLMYQKGIEQGNPDVASAIGVILIILVLVIALIQRRFVGEED